MKLIMRADDLGFSEAVNLINSFSHGRSYYDEHINFVTPKTMRNAVRVIIKVLFNRDSYHVSLITNDKIKKRNNVKNNVIKRRKPS